MLKDLGSSIQWLHSYVTNEKIYCVYFAQDEEKIREHARRAGLPVNRVSAVRRLLNPEKFQAPGALAAPHILQHLIGGHRTALGPSLGLLGFG